MTAAERIVRAAILQDGVVYTGKRHHLIINRIFKKTGKPVVGEQGFVTNTKRFVSRKEAAQIAYKAGQVNELKETIFSEDLW